MNQEIIRTGYGGDSRCRICLKTCEEHSWEETLACVRAEREQLANITCPACGLLMSQHSDDDIVRCARNKGTAIDRAAKVRSAKAKRSGRSHERALTARLTFIEPKHEEDRQGDD
jgi:hypothetical protein